MKKIKSWGNYPYFHGKCIDYSKDLLDKNFKIQSIPYGNGRSYGDSCLSKNIINIKVLDRFISFDQQNGTITTESGVLLAPVVVFRF